MTEPQQALLDFMIVAASLVDKLHRAYPDDEQLQEETAEFISVAVSLAAHHILPDEDPRHAITRYNTWAKAQSQTPSRH